jgi:hypothetical protein
VKKFQVELFKIERFSTLVEIAAENVVQAIDKARSILDKGEACWDDAVCQDEGVADITEVSK